MADPVRGVAYTTHISLDSVAGSGFQANPTIAAGDFKVSKDGGAFANLTTLPSVNPSGSIAVLISLSATEMTADKIVVTAIDVAGTEWIDMVLNIDVPTALTLDILEGDHVETAISAIVNKKGTSTAVVSKTIAGSLLNPGVTITTVDS